MVNQDTVTQQTGNELSGPGYIRALWRTVPCDLSGHKTTAVKISIERPNAVET